MRIILLLSIVENNLFVTYYDSPVGKLKITSTGSVIREVLFRNNDDVPIQENLNEQLPDVLQQCITELNEYFYGKRRNFDVPIEQDGTSFQKRVWDELLLIPFGKTISYLELAKRLGDLKSIRAAASTNGKNKIAVIVPCHRVIGSNNSLVGYGGGLPNKKWLLEHEAKIAHGVQTLF